MFVYQVYCEILKITTGNKLFGITKKNKISVICKWTDYSSLLWMIYSKYTFTD